MPRNPDARYICPFCGRDVHFLPLGDDGLHIVRSDHGWQSRPFKTLAAAKTWFVRFFAPGEWEVKETKKPGWYRVVGRGWQSTRTFHMEEIAEWWAKFLNGRPPGPKPGITEIREIVDPAIAEDVVADLDPNTVSVDEDAIGAYLEGRE